MRYARTIIGLMVPAVLSGAASLYGHGGDASLMHGCIDKKKGTLRIVAPSGACTTKETAQDWKIAGAAGPTGPTGAGGAGGATGPTGATGATGPARPLSKVVDQNGAFVGDVIFGYHPAGSDPLFNSVQVYLAFLGDPTIVLRSDTGLNGLTAAQVHYESTDCSGTPFVDPAEDISLLAGPLTAIGGPNSTLFASTGPKQAITARSRFARNFHCETLLSPEARDGLPAESLGDVDAMFVSPLKLQ
jgi:hypothetical protein